MKSNYIIGNDSACKEKSEKCVAQCPNDIRAEVVPRRCTLNLLRGVGDVPIQCHNNLKS